ncbi:MAG: hypothetical protein ABW005_10960 [Burkholderiaceae bacterium]
MDKHDNIPAQPAIPALTTEERDNLWYMPQVPGGRVVSEALQQRYEELGLVGRLPDGRRWPTMLGDRARRGAA